MLRAARIAIFGMCMVMGSFPARAGKYWICNHPSHKTPKQNYLQSLCMPTPEAEAEAAAHRKIHPKDVVVYTCVM